MKVKFCVLIPETIYQEVLRKRFLSFFPPLFPSSISFSPSFIFFPLCVLVSLSLAPHTYFPSNWFHEVPSVAKVEPLLRCVFLDKILEELKILKGSFFRPSFIFLYGFSSAHTSAHELFYDCTFCSLKRSH